MTETQIVCAFNRKCYIHSEKKRIYSTTYKRERCKYAMLQEEKKRNSPFLSAPTSTHQQNSYKSGSIQNCNSRTLIIYFHFPIKHPLGDYLKFERERERWKDFPKGSLETLNKIPFFLRDDKPLVWLTIMQRWNGLLISNT